MALGAQYGRLDGMLAYALFCAYERTGEARFYAAARTITDEMLAIPTWQCRLNGGLMVAMVAMTPKPRASRPL